MRNAVWIRYQAWIVALSSALMISSIFFLQYTASPYSLISILSWQASDLPWLPTSFASSGFAKPYFGVHHFGDLQIFQGYAFVENPYDSQLAIPAHIPPLGIWLYKLVFLLPSPIPLYVFLISSIGLASLVFGKLYPKQSGFLGLLLGLVGFVVLNAGVVIAIDRGGTQVIAFALGALSLLAAERDRRWRAALLLVLAASLKPYIILLIIYLVFRRKLKIATLASTLLVLLNVALMMTFEGDPVEQWKTLFSSISGYLDPELTATFMISNGTSLAGGLTQLVALIAGSQTATNILTLLPSLPTLISVFTLFLLALTLAAKRLPTWYSLTAVFATMQLASGAAGPYMTAWTFIGGAVFLTYRQHDPDRPISSIERVAAYSVGISLAISTLLLIAPVVALASELPYFILGREFLSPIGWLITMMLTLTTYYISAIGRNRVNSSDGAQEKTHRYSATRTGLDP